MNLALRAVLTALAFLVAIPVGLPLHEYLHCVSAWARGAQEECEVTFQHPGQVGPEDPLGSAGVDDDEKNLDGGGLTPTHVLIYALAQLALPIVAAITVWNATD